MPGGSGRREGGARSLAQSAGTTQVAGDNRDQTLKRESATIIGQRRGGAWEPAGCQSTYFTQMAPVPRYPSTFLAWHVLSLLWPARSACSAPSLEFLFWAAKRCSGDRQGSPHFASPQHTRNSQVRPPHGPPPGPVCPSCTNYS